MTDSLKVKVISIMGELFDLSELLARPDVDREWRDRVLAAVEQLDALLDALVDALLGALLGALLDALATGRVRIFPVHWPAESRQPLDLPTCLGFGCGLHTGCICIIIPFTFPF